VNPGSQACPAVIPDVIVTVRTIGLLAVVGIGAYVLGRGVLALDRAQAGDLDGDGATRTAGGGFRGLLISAVAVAIGFGLVALLPDTEIFTLTSVPVEPIAIIVGLPLVYLAAQVVAARDARRFVVGLLLAVGAWFVVWYPNIAALPLPSALVNAYQGLIPTYLYEFQFPVAAGERTVNAPLLNPTLVILGIAVTATCLVVAYSAWVWRLAIAESKAAATGSADDPGSDALARTGGGA
jgi:hypothetical protein